VGLSPAGRGDAARGVQARIGVGRVKEIKKKKRQAENTVTVGDKQE
jgi:hypothetical protein